MTASLSVRAVPGKTWSRFAGDPGTPDSLGTGPGTGALPSGLFGPGPEWQSRPPPPSVSKASDRSRSPGGRTRYAPCDPEGRGTDRGRTSGTALRRGPEGGGSRPLSDGRSASPSAPVGGLEVAPPTRPCGSTPDRPRASPCALWHPSLKTHSLSGQLKRLRTIRLTYEHRPAFLLADGLKVGSLRSISEPRRRFITSSGATVEVLRRLTAWVGATGAGLRWSAPSPLNSLRVSRPHLPSRLPR